MALKDIATDLSKFKYGLSSPDKVDNQIDNGVNFFDDNQGGATGFTPKAGDLESQYKKFVEGTVGTKWPEAARSNFKTRTAYGESGEYEEGNAGKSNFYWMNQGDTQLGPGVLSGFQPNYYADLLPIQASSMWRHEVGAYVLKREGTNPPNNDLMQENFKIYPSGAHPNTQITLRNIDGFSITSQPAELAYNNPFLPDAHKTSDDSGKWGGYNLPTPNSTAGQSQSIIINDKRRGVFDHLPILTFEHHPFPVNQPPNTVFDPTYDRYFSEMNGTSIHISPEGELKTGLRYGEKIDGKFTQLGSGVTITDIMDTKWPDNAPAKTITDRYSTLNYPYPISEGSRLHDWGDSFLEKWPDAAKSYDKERGGYDQYIHLTDDGFTSGPSNFPLNVLSSTISVDGLFNEIKTPGASVHVSKLDTDIKAGYLYGAYDSGFTDFKYYTQTEDGLIDLFSPAGSQNYSGPATLYSTNISGLNENSPMSAKRVVPISVRMGLARPLTQLERQQIAALEQQIDDAYQQQSDQDRFEDATQNPGPIIPSISDLESQIAEIQGKEVKANDFFAGSQMFSILPIQSSVIAKSNFNEGYNESNYLSENNLGPFLWGQTYNPKGLESLSGVQYKFLGFKRKDRIVKRPTPFDSDVGAVPWFELEGQIPNDLERYGGGKNFPKIPSGLDLNNKFGTDSYQKVANRGPHEGKNNHPLVLREIGNNWGVDNIPLDTNPIGDALGGMVRGAPGITGLISRNVTDKLRLGKFLFLTSAGLGFNIKQFALQALNPTLESKVYNPLSILGMAGGSEAASGVFDAVKGAISDIRGTNQVPGGDIDLRGFVDTVKSGISGDFLASLLLPIGHPERHLGGLKYEDVNPLTEISDESDLGKKIKSIPIVGGTVFDEINKKIGDLGGFSRLQVIAQDIKAPGFDMIGGLHTTTQMTLINPNRYLFPISSAPVMIERGVPSFTSGPDVARRDGLKIRNKKGFGPKGKPGTFNLNVDTDASGVKSYIELGDSKYKDTYKSELQFFGTEVKDKNQLPAGSKLLKLVTDKFKRTADFDSEAEITRTSDLEESQNYDTLSTGGVVNQRLQAPPAEGEVFNPNTAKSDDTAIPIKRHKSLRYDQLTQGNSYTADFLNPSELNQDKQQDVDELKKSAEVTRRIENFERNFKIGNSATSVGANIKEAEGDMAGLGKIAGDYKSGNVDIINITPVMGTGTNDEGASTLPAIITDNPDFIKFMFKDVINSKYIVFRAILESITDTVSPDYSEQKYIGRPDKLYTYQGTDRSISFGFKVYPKTKQELPVLIEKLNYLIGMCYPSYSKNERMITPFMQLTLGDMFNQAPGLLDTLTITVEDATTWEIDQGLEFPHFISCQCEFKYIGGEKNMPMSQGKFYDMPWTEVGDDGKVDAYSGTRKKLKYINNVGSTTAPSS